MAVALPVNRATSITSSFASRALRLASARVSDSAGRVRSRPMAGRGARAASANASSSSRKLPMISLDLSGVQGSNQLLAMVMTCASAWMEAALSDADGGQRWVIYDEAWRLMRQPALLARMQSQWKLSRGLGIANLLIVHRLSDLEAVGDADSEARALARGLLADCSTKVIYQQEISESPHTASELGLSVAERAQLPDLQRGEGLWRVGQRAFVVRHIATPRELSLFDTNARMQAPPAGRSATGAAPRPGALPPPVR